MSKRSNQSGSAHAVVIIILIVAILGLLGFVFWQNFIQKKSTAATTNSSTTSTNTTTKPVPAATLNTYTESSYGISFKYPSDWSVKVVSDPPINADLPSLEVTVADSTGKTVASLATGFEGGQTCDESVSLKLQTSDLTNLTLDGATVPVVYLANIYNDSNGVTKLIYGIAPAANAPSSNGTSTVTCNDNSSIFARLPIRGVGITAPYGSVAFDSSTTYDNTQDAQAYLQSSTYTQAATMIKSLTTTAISQ